MAAKHNQGLRIVRAINDPHTLCRKGIDLIGHWIERERVGNARGSQHHRRCGVVRAVDDRQRASHASHIDPVGRGIDHDAYRSTAGERDHRCRVVRPINHRHPTVAGATTVRPAVSDVDPIGHHIDRDGKRGGANCDCCC